MLPLRLTIFFFTFYSHLVFGENNIIINNDERHVVRSEYSFGFIPALAFDADQGIKYGGVINLFDHGKNKTPPQYEQHLFIRLTNSTGGSLNALFLLESESLFKNARFLGEIAYIHDKNLEFFGFNGHNAIYHETFTREGDTLFIQGNYYAHERSLFRLRLDFQHYIGNKHFRLLTGIQHNIYVVNPIEERPYQSERTLANNPAEGGTLFHKYQQWNIISEKERKGGPVSLLSAGLIYDTRNDHCFCTDGLWIDGYVVMAPGIFDSHSFSKFILTYRQHSSFFKEKLVLSLRVSSQQKLYGNIPYYMLPTYFDSRLNQDGIGGAFNLRGAMRNRIVSDGFAIANLEAKIRITDFYLFRQYFYASAALFLDMAYITQPYKTDLSSVPGTYRTRYFNDQAQSLHHTYGPGLYIVFNRNNAITINYGLATNPQDGKGGLYIGSSLLF